jgi:hypothetical protein
VYLQPSDFQHNNQEQHWRQSLNEQCGKAVYPHTAESN